MSALQNGRVGVIGSGLGGLSAACVLAGRGYDVTVFEKNNWIGGKAAVLRDQGYRFDMGPTILICPSILRKIFDETGRDMNRYLKLVKIEPQWRCFFEDKSRLDLHGDRQAMKQELTRLSLSGDAGYDKFLDDSRELHEISERFFFWRSIGSMRDTFKTGSALDMTLLRDVSRMKLGQTVAGAVRREIKDSRVAQMLDHIVQYVGSSPEKSPAILCAIAHMQTSEGIWYPIGGTRSIPEALHTLAVQMGVKFRSDTPIRRIEIENGRVLGVRTAAGEHVPLSAVVSNADCVRTYQELVGGHGGARLQSQAIL